MKIRPYTDNDCNTLSKLFYETVHTVNAKDYTQEQLSVWAANAGSLKSRKNDLLKQHTLVAKINGVIVGLGSIDNTGYLDLLFVHKDYQNQGVATALCNELEKGFSDITVFASITAKPFFEQRGYSVIKDNQVERFGIQLKNYEMKEKRNLILK